MGGVMTVKRSTVAKVADLAALVQHECTDVLIQYRNQENLPNDMGSDRLVFVSPPSSQLDIRSKLQSLHSGLDKCYSLLERAIALEKMELDRDQMSEYKNGRRRLKEELLNLLKSTEELLKAAGGKPVRNQDDLEPYHPNNVFHLKLWVYSVYIEVKLWSKTAFTVMKELQSAKEPLKRGKRSTRRTLQ
ncbi:ciliary neurotrophic factor [Gambusia affinis]|uniref:ciliary neurotrophic factor n=1 Tax=Gambusia affinis TaxID=33528 RepID=UPI001CDD3EAC|nr:ciliary neurotrophic factor [Gambusia affinis]